MKTLDDVKFFLENNLASYERMGKPYLRPGIERIKNLLNKMGNPHENGIDFIHVGGTNGKGSVVHMLASLLMSNNKKVGIHTSPHLIDFRERFKIDGKLLPQEEIIETICLFKDDILNSGATYFEATVALALYFFNKHKVDWGVVEVGLGGRLDATNIILPKLSVITTISLEHTDILGNTIREIAFEKAGIIKEGIPVLVGKLHQEALDVIKMVAKEKEAPLYEVKQFPEITEIVKKISHEIQLTSFQEDNFSLALCGYIILNGYLPPEEVILSAIKNVKERTFFYGRYEKVGENPEIILDVAHNPEAFNCLLENLKTNGNIHFICAFSNDKDVKSIFDLFPDNTYYYLTEYRGIRSYKYEELLRFLKNKKKCIIATSDPHKAFSLAYKNAKLNDTILIAGSFYLVNDFILKFMPNLETLINK